MDIFLIGFCITEIFLLISESSTKNDSVKTDQTQPEELQDVNRPISRVPTIQISPE